MCFYFVAEQTSDNFVALIPSEGIDITVDPVGFPNAVRYTQKKFGLYSPHGYYLSEEIKFREPTRGALLQCIASSGEGTEVKLFARVKEKGQEDFGEFEKADGLTYWADKDITHIQYAVALNTTDGKKTPSFTDVRITPGESLPPEEYAEKTASVYIAAAVSEKISYEHGERNEPAGYCYTAEYYFAPAQTERVSYEH